MSIKQNKYSNHTYFMNLAFMQANKILGNTSVNPAVGCIIVKKGYVLRAEHTGFNGRPHAEHNALNFLNDTKDLDLYVTLEPCSHYGKTFPCVNKIIKKKIKRVFFALKDPDARSYNKCKKILKNNNILVSDKILLNKAKDFYRSYTIYKKKSLPFVTAKIAISKDYFTINKKKKWITNKFSRSRVQLLRSYHDVILTSIKTIITDNPKLTCRIDGLQKFSPHRIILDKKLKIPITSNIVKSAKLYPTIIFFNKINNKKIKRLKKLKLKFYRMPLNNDDDFDLKKILIKIKSLGYYRIFLESGLNLTTKFLQNDLINDFKLFISGTNLGKNGINSFENNMKLFLKNKKMFNENVNLFDDKFITYRVK